MTPGPNEPDGFRVYFIYKPGKSVDKEIKHYVEWGWRGNEGIDAFENKENLLIDANCVGTNLEMSLSALKPFIDRLPTWVVKTTPVLGTTAAREQPRLVETTFSFIVGA